MLSCWLALVVMGRLLSALLLLPNRGQVERLLFDSRCQFGTLQGQIATLKICVLMVL